LDERRFSDKPGDNRIDNCSISDLTQKIGFGVKVNIL